MLAVAPSLYNIAAMKRDVSFVAYATIKHHKDWRYPPHQHPHHEIITVEHGAMSVVLNGQPIIARAGDVLFYKAGNPHKEDADPRQLALTLCLSYSGKYLADRIGYVTHDANGRVRQMLHWIADDMSLPEDVRMPRMAGLIAAVVEELAWLAQPRQHPLVERTRMFMERNLSKRIRLDDLATNAGMSKFYFLRQYYQIAGRTPMQELCKQRLERARNLIVSTSWPLRFIAGQVGFNNEFHLSKLFKQHLGIAPSSLRTKREDVKRENVKT
jgi:AraC-like DNA-binding protein